MYERGGPSVLRRVLHVLLPCPCLGCRQPVVRPAESPGLCPQCLDRLVPSPAEAIGDEAGEAGEAGEPPGWAFEYRPPLDEVILALKFRRLDYLATPLAALALPAALRAVTRLGGVDAVVPVPLHWRRRWRRGYDQAALLASALAGHLGAPSRHLLRRSRATPAQSLSGRQQRRQNLAGAFVPRHARRTSGIVGKRLLLVDDVVTTGSTLGVAAECLLRAGALRVLQFAVAYTPEDRSDPSECG